MDSETGLYYVRNRYYAAGIGRFLSHDPIGIWGDSGNLGNGYSYGASRPLSVVDRNGLQGDSVTGDSGSGTVYRNGEYYFEVWHWAFETRAKKKKRILKKGWVSECDARRVLGIEASESIIINETNAELLIGHAKPLPERDAVKELQALLGGVIDRSIANIKKSARALGEAILTGLASDEDILALAMALAEGDFGAVLEITGEMALAGAAGIATAGVGFWVWKANKARKLFRRIFGNHGPGQGFTGVLDTVTGEITLAASGEGQRYPRRGGHARLADDLGGSRGRYHGFSVVIGQDGALDVGFQSGSLNATNPQLRSRLIPRGHRSRRAILQYLRGTGRKLNQLN